MSILPRVFLASSSEGKDIAYAIQSDIQNDAEATVWNQGIFQPSGFPLDDLLAAASAADFAVFVFSPADKLTIREKTFDSVRDNVLFELGLFMGKLGRQRSFVVAPKDRDDLRFATDLAGITAISYDDKRLSDLEAAVGPVCFKLKQAFKKVGALAQAASGDERILYGEANFDTGDFRGLESYIYEGKERKSNQGKGKLVFEPGNTLSIHRDNIDGRFEIQLRRDGPKSVSVTKNVNLRRLRVSCDVKAEGGNHSLRFLFKDEEAQKWAADQRVDVASGDWTHVDLQFRVPPTVDLLFRIDDEKVSHAPSRVSIRGLAIAERPS